MIYNRKLFMHKSVYLKSRKLSFAMSLGRCEIRHQIAVTKAHCSRKLYGFKYTELCMKSFLLSIIYLIPAQFLNMAHTGGVTVGMFSVTRVTRSDHIKSVQYDGRGLLSLSTCFSKMVKK